MALLKASLLVPAGLHYSDQGAVLGQRLPTFSVQLTVHSQDIAYSRVNIRGS